MHDQATIERFWTKVDRSGGANACWIWIAGRDQNGYGEFWIVGERRLKKAHRVAWEIDRGPIQDGLFVCHHCDNPPCCNTSHLYMGTVLDNTRDAAKRGLLARGRFHGDKVAGTLSGSNKLTDAQVLNIFKASGETQRQLATRHGVSVTTIGNIRRGLRWWRLTGCPPYSRAAESGRDALGKKHTPT